MSDAIVIDIKWGKIATVLASATKLAAITEREFKVAARRSGLQIAALMRSKIQGGVPPPNAAMTAQMKGSTKPLVDSGRLFKAITSEVESDYLGQDILVGVKRSHEAANVASVVHDGRRQRVTRKMAMLFRVLWMASRGRPIVVRSPRGQRLLAASKGIIPPLREGSTLVVPPRPFALLTLQDPRVRGIVELEYREALRRAWDKVQR